MITHDFGVVSELCERVIVMYTGKIVEEAPAEKIFEKPLHPYTEGLIESIPQIMDQRKTLSTIDGTVPNPTETITGCSFWPRCRYATEKCKTEEPPVFCVSQDRKVRCWRYDKQNG